MEQGNDPMTSKGWYDPAKRCSTCLTEIQVSLFDIAQFLRHQPKLIFNRAKLDL